MALSLSDAEHAAVQAVAAPIYPSQRDAFLKALAVELERPSCRWPWPRAPRDRGATEDLRRDGAY